MAEESVKVPYEVASECFFVIDDYGDKDTPLDEKLLFFAPESYTDLVRKTHLSSSVQKIADFMRTFQFSSGPLSILTFTNLKFATIQKGHFTFAVSGKIEEPDSSLLKQIELLYNAFIFYWGPIDFIRERITNRNQFIQCMEQQCRILVPLLESYRSQKKLNPFDWLPFSNSGPNTNRHFMKASNILSSLHVEENVYGGCLFYNSSVFCTHLSIPITHWVLNMVQLLRQSQGRGQQQNLVWACAPVYLTRDQCRLLLMEEDMEENITDFNMERSFWVVEDKNSYEDSKEGKYVQLCILLSNQIAMALLMRKTTRSRNFREIAVMRHIDSTIHSLEEDINATTSNLGKSSSGDLHPTLNLTFDYLTTHSLTGMVKGSTLSPCFEGVDDQEARFIMMSSHIHEVFARNRKINKVLLADHCSLFYARCLFTRELYYQTYPQDALIERTEQSAERDLTENQIDFI